MTVPGVTLTQNKTKTNQDSDFQEIQLFFFFFFWHKRLRSQPYKSRDTGEYDGLQKLSAKEWTACHFCGLPYGMGVLLVSLGIGCTL